MEPMDSIAFIGRNPMDEDNIYIATGDSGNGMTHGTIAGMLITDLILGRDSEWEKIYDPSRFKFFKSGKIFLKELIGGLKNYYQTNPEETGNESLMSIETGKAKIIQLEGKKYGVFHEQEGEYHFVSAECTHLKCTVKWNDDEKSWDCPCHGSRFTHEGKVLNGPANADLHYHKELISEVVLAGR